MEACAYGSAITANRREGTAIDTAMAANDTEACTYGLATTANHQEETAIRVMITRDYFVTVLHGGLMFLTRTFWKGTTNKKLQFAKPQVCATKPQSICLVLSFYSAFLQ